MNSDFFSTAPRLISGVRRDIKNLRPTEEQPAKSVPKQTTEKMQIKWSVLIVKTHVDVTSVDALMYTESIWYFVHKKVAKRRPHKPKEDKTRG